MVKTKALMVHLFLNGAYNSSVTKQRQAICSYIEVKGV